ncbi:MAG: phage terminase large subunit family protein [Niveispirillum sp.]|uniref:phage terminase large subunit family protein n=1 Tax=Niveispirillum sp. TaxID=1917217 RepID=UPI00403680EC
MAIRSTAPEAMDALRSMMRLESRAALMPPPSMTVDAWADTYRVLGPEGNAVPGPWRTSTQEVARGPMRAVTEPGVRTITVKACTQILKTSLLENVFGYFAHLDPCPMLYIQPKEDAALKFSKKKISPMIRHTPVLRDLVSEAKGRDGDNTQLYKKFPGGDLTISSAGSPTNLAMISIRVVGLDETNKYVDTPEGDPISLAEERMSSYTANSLSIRVCSPTTKDGQISVSYADSDQRRPYVSCPHCQHEQVMVWGQVQWDKDDDGNHSPGTARYYCEACGVGWTDRERTQAIRQTLQWRQTRIFKCCGEEQDPQRLRVWRWAPEHLVGYAACRHCGKERVSNRHAGYWASKLYSCTQALSDIVYKWLDAQNDIEKLRFFINTQLAEDYEERGAKIDETELMSRRENYASIIPDDGAVLVASVDTQDNRLEVLILSYGMDEASSIVDHIVLPGDPGQGAVWDELDELLLCRWRRHDGREFSIQAACIDAGGHHSQRVYDFCQARVRRRIWAIRGAAERNGARNPVWPKKVSNNKAGKLFYYVGTNAAKDQLHARLKITTPGPGYIRFGSNLDREFFDQLTAEKLVTRYERGEYRRYWVNPEKKRNEAWDLMVYAYAALCGLKASGLQLNAVVARSAPSLQPPPAGPQKFAAAAPAEVQSHGAPPSTRNLDPGAAATSRDRDHAPVGERDADPCPPQRPSPPPARAQKPKRRTFVMGYR